MADYLSGFQNQTQASLYYLRKRGVKAPQDQVHYTRGYTGSALTPGYLDPTFMGQVANANQDASSLIARRQRLGTAQGADGTGDLTDSVIQDAAARERRRRSVGRTRASTFLSPSQSLLASAGGY